MRRTTAGSPVQRLQTVHTATGEQREETGGLHETKLPERVALDSADVQQAQSYLLEQSRRPGIITIIMIIRKRQYITHSQQQRRKRLFVLRESVIIIIIICIRVYKQTLARTRAELFERCIAYRTTYIYICTWGYIMMTRYIMTAPHFEYCICV